MYRLSKIPIVMNSSLRKLVDIIVSCLKLQSKTNYDSLKPFKMSLKLFYLIVNALFFTYI